MHHMERKFLSKIRDEKKYASENGSKALYLLQAGADEINRISATVAQKLGPVPANHNRLFHGTDADAVESILTEGILEDIFEERGDFGPGF